MNSNIISVKSVLVLISKILKENDFDKSIILFDELKEKIELLGEIYKEGLLIINPQIISKEGFLLELKNASSKIIRKILFDGPLINFKIDVPIDNSAIMFFNLENVFDRVWLSLSDFYVIHHHLNENITTCNDLIELIDNFIFCFETSIRVSNLQIKSLSSLLLNKYNMCTKNFFSTTKSKGDSYPHINAFLTTNYIKPLEEMKESKFGYNSMNLFPLLRKFDDSKDLKAVLYIFKSCMKNNLSNEHTYLICSKIFQFKNISIKEINDFVYNLNIFKMANEEKQFEESILKFANCFTVSEMTNNLI